VHMAQSSRPLISFHNSARPYYFSSSKDQIIESIQAFLKLSFQKHRNHHIPKRRNSMGSIDLLIMFSILICCIFLSYFLLNRMCKCSTQSQHENLGEKILLYGLCCFTTEGFHVYSGFK